MRVTFDVLDPTSIIAWIGALTGAAALTWQIFTWRRSAHRVKVTRSQAWFSYQDQSLSEALVCVTARNVGAAAVTVINWGVELPGKNNLIIVRPIIGSTELPHRLEPGAEGSWRVLASELQRVHMERGVPFKLMRPWVGLATGKKVYARKAGVPVSS